MKYAEPSYTGFVFPVDKYFPAWALAEDHVLVRAGLEAAATARSTQLILPASGTSAPMVSTGWARPASRRSVLALAKKRRLTRHEDSVLLADVVKATEFYALLPALL